MIIEAMFFFLISISIAVVSRVLGEDAKTFLPRFCRKMLSKSSKTLNAKQALRYEEEWLCHHNEIEEIFGQLLHACGIYFFGARRIGQVVGFCRVNCSYNRSYKRVIDTAIAVTLLVFQFPLLLAIMLFQIIEGRRIFCTSTRTGLNGKQIKIIGFMINTVDSQDADMTRGERFLLRVGFNELPQIFNVLIGDLSIVGPPSRPFNQLEKLDRNLVENDGFLKVRPGFIQIRQHQLPVGHYEDNVSFSNDMGIMLWAIYSRLCLDEVAEE